MTSPKKYKLVIVIAPKGRGSKIVVAAKKGGALGGTIISGRGTASKGIYERILGIAYEPEKELVLIGVHPPQLDAVLSTVTEAGNLDKPVNGVGFVLG